MLVERTSGVREDDICLVSMNGAIEFVDARPHGSRSPAEKSIRKYRVFRNIARLTVLEGARRSSLSSTPLKRIFDRRCGGMGLISIHCAIEFVNAGPDGGGLAPVAGVVVRRTLFEEVRRFTLERNSDVRGDGAVRERAGIQHSAIEFVNAKSSVAGSNRGENHVAV
ncbi:MAG TPA: hypothetical protein VGL53_21080 [Bryobacteraceae bacterium]|jgi:hypothetical protein